MVYFEGSYIVYNENKNGVGHRMKPMLEHTARTLYFD